MSRFGIAWALLAVAFVVIEGLAIFGPSKGMTLSAHVWRFMDTGWPAKGVVIAFSLWLAVHFIARGRIW